MTEPMEWQDRAPLSGPDLYDLLALERFLRAVSVVKVGERYVADEQRVAYVIQDHAPSLIAEGHIRLSAPDPELGGIQRVTVTESGKARLAELRAENGMQPKAVVVVSARSCSCLETTMPDLPSHEGEWVRSPKDGTSHRLAEGEPRRIGTAEAVCGHVMPSSVKQEVQPTPPNPHKLCEVCRPRNGVLVPLPPVFRQQPPPSPPAGPSPQVF